jgi:hypothetical protein
MNFCGASPCSHQYTKLKSLALGSWDYTTLVALTRVYDIGFSSFVDTSAGRLQVRFPI